MRRSYMSLSRCASRHVRLSRYHSMWSFVMWACPDRSSPCIILIGLQCKRRWYSNGTDSTVPCIGLMHIAARHSLGPLHIVVNGIRHILHMQISIFSCLLLCLRGENAYHSWNRLPVISDNCGGGCTYFVRLQSRHDLQVSQACRLIWSYDHHSMSHDMLWVMSQYVVSCQNMVSELFVLTTLTNTPCTLWLHVAIQRHVVLVNSDRIRHAMP